MLRCAIMQYDKEWDELLAITELCYNASPHKSTGFAPHKLCMVLPLRHPY